MSTKVQNPVRRAGWPAYKVCRWCGETFTALGLPRHWDRCPKKVKNERPQPTPPLG